MKLIIFPAIALAASMPFYSEAAARQAGAAAATAQESFATPDAAAQELLRAAEAGDMAAIGRLFGRNSTAIISSGDAVQDKSTRAKFVQKATEGMKVEKDPKNSNRAFIFLGADSFQFPIPLVRTNGRWRFDTEAGRREVLARRIGANELDAIAVCREYVQAQYRYAAEYSDKNGVHQYAQRFISSPGSKDGLYWPASSGAAPSAISARITQAAAQGYTQQPGRLVPYHGYYYRILKAQGPSASGGAKDYLVQGLMIGGFGLVAWPAKYGNSGIMTFMVNQNGVVYQKDLGPNTSAIAESMMSFNPDRSWRAVQ